MYQLMLPSDYVNSKLTVNSHLECFAGSAAGLGCLWAFLTPPGLFFYSCYACRSKTKSWKYIKKHNSTLRISPSTFSFNTSHSDITGCVAELPRERESLWGLPPHRKIPDTVTQNSHLFLCYTVKKSSHLKINIHYCGRLPTKLNCGS